jgi:hypothetical protein
LSGGLFVAVELERTMNILRTILTGIGATLTMDLVSAAGRRAGLLHGVEIEWIQRWFGSALRGHPLIGDVRAMSTPGLPLGATLLVHYAIGITLAIVYGILAGSRGSVSMAVAFGLLTCALPWLFMFPGMGLGVFGVNAPSEALLVRTSLVNHLAYGLALGLLLRAWPAAATVAR